MGKYCDHNHQSVIEGEEQFYICGEESFNKWCEMIVGYKKFSDKEVNELIEKVNEQNYLIRFKRKIK